MQDALIYADTEEEAYRTGGESAAGLFRSWNDTRVYSSIEAAIDGCVEIDTSDDKLNELREEAKATGDYTKVLEYRRSNCNALTAQAIS